jgi:hypothetical protein
MNMQTIKVGFLAVMLTMMVGCANQPLKNVIDSPVTTSGKQATMEDVKKAIVTAGTALGWKLTDVAPGKMVGLLDLRKHSATVDIAYDTKKYSINYKDSTDLKYDGSTIHKNYNSWVQNLDKGISKQLGLI